MNKIVYLLVLLLSSHNNQLLSKTYDYVVIGTGPGGAVFANILSENNKNSVLVLEAGSNQVNEQPITDSLFAPILTDQYFPQYFWQGETTPQEFANGEGAQWTTGRILGGGSSINGQQYVRPTLATMQDWENLLGPLWSPLNSLQTFIALEDFSGVPGFFNPLVHGYNGPIDIRQAPVNPTDMATKLTQAITDATEIVFPPNGFPLINDYNDPATPLGPFTRWQLFQQPNEPYNRSSAATSFLPPTVMSPLGCGVGNRRLQVLFNTTVLRIQIKNQRAVGVHYLQNGCSRCAGARKGVILAAGINDAQLLMLSGVGPTDVLTNASIPVKVHNANVGQDLRNHLISFAVFSTNPADSPLPANDPQALYTAGAFLPDPTPGAPTDRRGVQLICSSSGGNTVSIAIILLDPQSRGTIAIQNRDPLKIALVNEGFYQNPVDLESMRNIFRDYILNINTALATIDPLYTLIAPTPAVIADDALLDAYIRNAFSQTHHMQSSCRMAPIEQGGVVDALGRVYGVGSLIIGDAQVFPVNMPGNTAAPAFMVSYILANQLVA